MPDAAQINRSISTIKTELEYLSQAGVLSPPQVQSIAAQLPVSLCSISFHFLVQFQLQSLEPVYQREEEWEVSGWVFLAMCS